MDDFYILPDETSKPDTRNKKTLHGQKPPLKPREVWAIRTRLELQGKRRDLALFNLAIDSKLRSCDLVWETGCVCFQAPAAPVHLLIGNRRYTCLPLSTQRAKLRES